MARSSRHSSKDRLVLRVGVTVCRRSILGGDITTREARIRAVEAGALRYRGTLPAVSAAPVAAHTRTSEAISATISGSVPIGPR